MDAATYQLLPTPFARVLDRSDRMRAGRSPDRKSYGRRSTLLNISHSIDSPLGTIVAQEPFTMLKVAIKHAKLDIVNYLLEAYPNLMSQTHPDNTPLQEAIFSGNNEVLKAVLTYTPRLPDLLTYGLSRYVTFLPRSGDGAETIRLLIWHFSPLSVECRTWLIMHSCAVGDVPLLEEFKKTGPLFSHRIYYAGGRIPTYIHFAIRSGNVDALRFLLDHGVIEEQQRHRQSMAMEQALSFNQIRCYRELYPRFDVPVSARFFQYLTSAENAEEVLSEYIGKDRHLILEYKGEPQEEITTLAQRALWNAIRRLRPGNVQFLLDAGVMMSSLPPFDHDPFRINWPYFNQHRDAFLLTQKVLDSFGLPKLRINF